MHIVILTITVHDYHSGPITLVNNNSTNLDCSIIICANAREHVFRVSNVDNNFYMDTLITSPRDTYFELGQIKHYNPQIVITWWRWLWPWICTYLPFEVYQKLFFGKLLTDNMVMARVITLRSIICSTLLRGFMRNEISNPAIASYCGIATNDRFVQIQMRAVPG